VKTEPLVFLGTCDLAGLVRGKGFPAADLPSLDRKAMDAVSDVYDSRIRAYVHGQW